MAEEQIKDENKEILPNVDGESSNSSDEVGNQDLQNDENDENSNEEDESTKQKQVPILNKILFGLAGFLLLILIAGIVLFFMGFFDNKEEAKTEKINEVQKQEVIIEEKSNFNINDINSKKLNKQLLLLTNKNIIQEEENNRREKEAQEKKIKEEEKKKKEEALAIEEDKLSKEKEELENKRLELEKEKKELELLKNEAIALRNEMINSKKSLEIKNEEIAAEKIVKEEITQIKEEIKEVKIIDNEVKFILLINVAKIKGELYKTYLDKITSIYSDIKLCRDDVNRIEVYYGPFENNNVRNDIYKKLQENGIINSYEVELTQEEFDKRCSY